MHHVDLHDKVYAVVIQTDRAKRAVNIGLSAPQLFTKLLHDPCPLDPRVASHDFAYESTETPSRNEYNHSYEEYSPRPMHNLESHSLPRKCDNPCVAPRRTLDFGIKLDING